MMKIAALAGGVGGAKLADGLAQALHAESLTIIVNTGDDFEHLGLKICPDLDTVCYTLAGLANPVTGWGRHGESWAALETIGLLGGPTWFRLGDYDLGLHLERTRRLLAGQSLTRITRDFCRSLGVGPRVIPMSDDSVPTWVYTKDEGDLPFQEYFVHHQCRPTVTGFHFQGVEDACPAPGVLEALAQSDLVVFCPSNPWVSIDPILALPGIRAELQDSLVIAVSPIIGGQAIKGPAAKMYSELGIQPSALAVAEHYGDLLDGFVLDNQDAKQEPLVEKLGVRARIAQSIMKTSHDRLLLAEEVIRFGEDLLAGSL